MFRLNRAHDVLFRPSCRILCSDVRNLFGNLSDLAAASSQSTCAFCSSPGYTRYFDRTSVYLCASPLQNLAVPQDFYSPVNLSGTIWLTPYSMVWDWRVSRAGPIRFCWPSCSLLFCLQLFSISLLFLYTL